MSYSTPEQLRTQGLANRRYSNVTDYPDQLLQSALDKAFARINSYLGTKYKLPLVGDAPQFLVDAEILGASWFLLQQDGIAPNDVGTQMLYDSYQEYYGPNGLLWRIGQGQMVIENLVDSTPSTQEGRSRFVNRSTSPSVRTFDNRGNEYF